MKRKLFWIPVLSAALTLGLATACAHRRERRNIDTSTDDRLSLERFSGLWYEIARMNHIFERGMSSVTARYRLLGDGSIEVVNDGVKGDRRRYRRVVGRAVMPDATQPRRLRVSFFPMIYSDYNILSIDDDYSSALIGGSSPGFLWILSRTPSLPTERYTELLHEAARRGYDVSRLIMVDQR